MITLRITQERAQLMVDRHLGLLNAYTRLSFGRQLVAAL